MLGEVTRVPRRSQSGFTLIELMIVVIVVGVLAAVAIPLYQVAAARSKATEAVAALGLARTAMRAYYAEHGTYENAAFTDGGAVTAGEILAVTDDDLAGRYFSTECYTFDGAPTIAAFRVKCTGASSTAPNASEALAIVTTIDEDGDITHEW